MFSQLSRMDNPAFIVNKNPVKLQNLCRMCATPCNKSVPIFGPVGEENELASKFNNYLPLKVSQTDSIPLQLCYECTNLLIQWDAAILVAVAADKKLRALLWREQQTQHINSQNTIGSEESELQKKRKRELSGVRESLSCSVCNSSGMDFRELVDHLKTHEETERSSRHQNSEEIVGSEDDCTIDDLLTPVVCLETFDSEKELSPKIKDSNLKSPQIKKGRKGRPKGRSFYKLVSESDDPIVTSSTSTPRQKSVETIEIDNTHSTPHIIKTNINANFSTNAATTASKKELSPDNQNNAFKPKVRIISAESINQTLEERAKANQTARNLESHPPNILVCSPSSGGLSPTSPTKMPLRRIVLSGQVVNGVNFNVPKPGQKFLKLADGRLIKIIQNTGNTPVPAGQNVQKVQVLTKVVPNSDKAASVLRPASPDAFKSTGSQTASKPTRSLIKIDDLKKVVKVGDKQIRYTQQPGPKHCPNRYICALCGKRNLTEEMLHEHSQLHKDDQLPSN